MRDRGKYLFIWRNLNNVWSIECTIWSSDLPEMVPIGTVSPVAARGSRLLESISREPRAASRELPALSNQPLQLLPDRQAGEQTEEARRPDQRRGPVRADTDGLGQAPPVEDKSRTE